MELGVLLSDLGPLLNQSDGRKNKVKLEGDFIVVLDAAGHELAKIEVKP